MRLVVQVKGLSFTFTDTEGQRVALVVLNREHDDQGDLTQVDIHYTKRAQLLAKPRPMTALDMTRTIKFRGQSNTVQHISKSIIKTIYGQQQNQAGAATRLGQLLSVVA